MDKSIVYSFGNGNSILNAMDSILSAIGTDTQSASPEDKIRQMSNENTARTFDFNSQEAQKTRDWQEHMSGTAHQRQVADLKRAGLNPVLSANSGAQSYSGASASGTADSSAVGALASIYQTKMNNDNARQIAEMQNKNAYEIAKLGNQNALEVARINQAASNYASNNSYAASRYASDLSSSASRYKTDKSYRQSDYGMLEDLGLSSNLTKGAKVGNMLLKNFGFKVNIGKSKGKKGN